MTKSLRNGSAALAKPLGIPPKQVPRVHIVQHIGQVGGSRVRKALESRCIHGFFVCVDGSQHKRILDRTQLNQIHPTA